jgi:DNA replication protein DnaC
MMTAQKNEALLMARANTLKLHGLLAHWDEVAQSDWIEPLIGWEEEERARRGLERRMSGAHLGRFKPLADFDWSWPKHCDHDAINDLMQLQFLKQATNVILVGPNGVGKSTIARNIAHQAVLHGHNVLFISASQMLNELAAQDSDSMLKRRLARYTRPHLLVIDEVGYLSYSNRHADLLFDIVSRRYEEKATLVTTNRPFSEWSEVFPSASCVVSLVDRLVHHSEIISIEGDSYRLKEAKEHQQQQTANRKKRKTAPRKKGGA